MRTRIISGTIIGAVLLLLLYFGGVYLNTGIIVICLVGLYEFHKVITAYKLKPFKELNYIVSIIYLLLIMFLKSENYSIVLQATFILYTLVLLFIFLLNDNIKPMDISMNLFSMVYVVFTLSHMMFLSDSKFIWLVFITAWSTDTFAYFAGNLLGKKKLCPKLSPKKTVGGAIGGMIGCIVSSILFGYIFKIDMILTLGLLGLVTSIFAQIGDIAASKFKRIAGIKDYGNFMPGHGGMLDRFDSIIFTAPIVYYFTIFLM
ncbi:phosphatidate cytidylyltransferase [Clostridiaceae bacterium M8S5]|nr:phosphatidate cytidylyltransferase [Clostridiaceae bacterium M8S5]